MSLKLVLYFDSSYFVLPLLYISGSSPFYPLIWLPLGLTHHQKEPGKKILRALSRHKIQTPAHQSNDSQHLPNLSVYKPNKITKCPAKIPSRTPSRKVKRRRRTDWCGHYVTSSRSSKGVWSAAFVGLLLGNLCACVNASAKEWKKNWGPRSLFYLGGGYTHRVRVIALGRGQPSDPRWIN